MTPQMYTDLKWLVGQKQWQTSLKAAFEDELKSMKDTITSCDTDEKLRALRASVNFCGSILSIIEQRVEDYEENKDLKESKA